MFEPPGIVFNFLLIVMVFLILVLIELKDLLYAVIVAAVQSILLAFLFFMLKAPDIALTQVTIGAGILTALFVAVLMKTSRIEED